MRYWEKTVEYKFVCELCRHQTAYGTPLGFAPLDGKHEENAGDGIFSSYDKFWLIEFKRNVSSIDDENRKFDIGAILYDPILRDGNQHHVIIYGSTEERDGLQLRAIRYIKALEDSHRNGEEISSLYGAMLSNHHDITIYKFKPCDLENFKKYIKALSQYRLGRSDASGGSGGVAPDFLECAVLCLDEHYNIAALSLSEFMQANGPEYDIQLDLDEYDESSSLDPS